MLYLTVQRESISLLFYWPLVSGRHRYSPDSQAATRNKQGQPELGRGTLLQNCGGSLADEHGGNQLCALFWILIWLSHRGPSFRIIVQHGDINRTLLGPSWTKFPQAICNAEILARISIQQKEQIPNYPYLKAGPHLILWY